MTSDTHFSHALSFVGANGLGYTRTVYADKLYVFSTHKGQLLTGMRYVPFNDLLFATYMALRVTRDEEDDTSALPSFVEETQSLNSGTTAFPFAETALSLPPEIEQKAHDLIASTYQKVVGYTWPAPDLTRMDQALGERFTHLSFATGLDGRDVGWITVGNSLLRDQPGRLHQVPNACRGRRCRIRVQPALRQPRATQSGPRVAVQGRLCLSFGAPFRPFLSEVDQRTTPDYWRRAPFLATAAGEYNRPRRSQIRRLFAVPGYNHFGVRAPRDHRPFRR